MREMRGWMLAVVLAEVLAWGMGAGAQTYTPKQIRVKAPAGTDMVEALKIVGLKEGVPLTKEEIEAGLRRLVDTGLFKDVGYTVNSEALVIELTPSASTQMVPVGYANFVWWKQAELEGLVEARVPAFHGKLPLAGTLTDQVEDALTELMKDKGIDAEVGARQSEGTILLSLARPKVVVGSVKVSGTTATVGGDVAKLKTRLTGEEFEVTEMSRAIQRSVADLEQNAGYLDVRTTELAVSAPLREGNVYAVSVTATVVPGEMYRVSQMAITAAPPLSQTEVEKVAEIKVGDAASPMALRIAKGELQKEYVQRGYLDVQVQMESTKDSGAHTVAYAVGIVPGGVYRFGSMDASALTAEQQARFAKALHATPEMVAGRELLTAISRVIGEMYLERVVTLQSTADRKTHTVAYALKPFRAGTPAGKP